MTEADGMQSVGANISGASALVGGANGVAGSRAIDDSGSRLDNKVTIFGRLVERRLVFGSTTLIGAGLLGVIASGIGGRSSGISKNPYTIASAMAVAAGAVVLGVGLLASRPTPPLGGAGRGYEHQGPLPYAPGDTSNKHKHNVPVDGNSFEDTSSYTVDADGRMTLSEPTRSEGIDENNPGNLVRLLTAPNGFAFAQTDLRLPPGRTTFELENVDQSHGFHNIVIRGNGLDVGSREVGKGGRTGVTVNLEPGKTYEYLCVAHLMWGMRGTITVEG